jgi:stearoyl-CoA desaturase (delta-9 desaturase)
MSTATSPLPPAPISTPSLAPTRAARALGALSTVLLLVMHLAVLLVFTVPWRWQLLALGLGSYTLRMWAITAGYHRYFSHRAFKTSRVFQFILGLLGTTAMQNGPLWWASWHRTHHRHSDTPDDAHSPVQRGFWHAHIGWFLDGSHDRPNLANVRDLARYPELRFLDRHKWLPIVAYAGGMYLIAGYAGVVWGFVVATMACLQATMCINSLAHVWGSRRFETTDDSRNNALCPRDTRGGLAQQPPSRHGLGPAGAALVGARRHLLHAARAGACRPDLGRSPSARAGSSQRGGGRTDSLARGHAL